MIDLGLCSSEEILGRLRRSHAAQSFRRAFAETSAGGRAGLCSGAARICRHERRRERKRLRYDIVDKFDEATGLSAMMRTTAFPASIIAQMMARGDVLMRGATPQEKAIDAEKFVAELARRNINIREF